MQRDTAGPRPPAEAPLTDEERARAELSDLSGDGGGQRTEVEHPYSGAGDVQRGVERALQWERERRLPRLP